MRILAALLLGSVFLPAWSGKALAVEVSIREWPVPWPESRPRDPAVAGDGRVWFVGQEGDYLAVMDPPGDGENGEPAFRRYDLPEGTGPHNVVIGPEGDPWVAGNRNHRILRVSPETGEITEYLLKNKRADPHTQRFGPNGDLWFTLQHFNAIGRLKIADGDIDLVRLPMGRVRPYGLDIDADGNPWFAEFGSNRLAQLRAGKLEVNEFPVPRWDARPRRLAVAADGHVWYVDYAGGYLGRLDPLSVRFQEWSVPAGGDARPYAMGLDGKGRPWFVQTGVDPNTLVGFDPRTRRYVAEVAIPSGAGAVRNMVWDPARSCFWFGTDADTIVRAHIR